MYPHRIRLRGPWECHTGVTQTTVTVPCYLRNVVPPGFHGPVRLLRKFGYPGQIDAFERVWLTFAEVNGVAEITVNGSMVGRNCSASCEFDITSLLGERNRLEVDLVADSDACGLTGEIALEVRCAVYLRDVQVRRHSEELVATGQIVGVWPEPFDLYMLLDGANVYYSSVRTGPAPTSFKAVLSVRTDPAKKQTLRVELVQGPSVWFRTDLQVPVTDE